MNNNIQTFKMSQGRIYKTLDEEEQLRKLNESFNNKYRVKLTSQCQLGNAGTLRPSLFSHTMNRGELLSRCDNDGNLLRMSVTRTPVHLIENNINQLLLTEQNKKDYPNMLAKNSRFSAVSYYVNTKPKL
jgi:hypothetical protein